MENLEFLENKLKEFVDKVKATKKTYLVTVSDNVYGSKGSCDYTGITKDILEFDGSAELYSEKTNLINDEYGRDGFCIDEIRTICYRSTNLEFVKLLESILQHPEINHIDEDEYIDVFDVLFGLELFPSDVFEVPHSYDGYCSVQTLFSDFKELNEDEYVLVEQVIDTYHKL